MADDQQSIPEGDQIRAEVRAAFRTGIDKLNDLAKRGYTINIAFGAAAPGEPVSIHKVEVLKAI